MAFRYHGPLAGSKSIINRLLIIKSFESALTWSGDSTCEDVHKMEVAVQNIGQESIFDCGAAGSVLRFLAFRLSRESGFFHLKGDASLFLRPQSELLYILEQLGPKVQLIDQGILIEGTGWQVPLLPISVPRTNSSQFLSGLLLSAWNLPFDLDIDFSDTGVSQSYLKLTQEILGIFGMRFERKKAVLTIPKDQTVEVRPYAVEMDMSSCAYLAGAALLDGDIEVHPYLPNSRQPDQAIVGFLQRMGGKVEVNGQHFRAATTPRLRGANFDLKSNPDLFPALAILSAFAQGHSRFTEVSHLKFKESNRFEKVLELLSLSQVKFEVDVAGTLTVHGRENFRPAAFTFDPAEDHRMAMAASLLQLREPNIKILNEVVVRKSFPNYWDIIRKKT